MSSIPNYLGSPGEFDDGAYNLIADGKRVGEILFYADAYRIVKTFAALRDPKMILAAMGAEALTRTSIENVEDVVATLVKIGDING